MKIPKKQPASSGKSIGHVTAAVILITMFAAASTYMLTRSDAASTLTWAPPSTAGYATYNISTSGGVVTLNDSLNYILKMPSSPVTETLTIKGGRNIIMIGGHIRRNDFNGYAESGQTALRIFKSDAWTESNQLNNGRIVFIEGLLADGYYLSDGLVINAPEANVYFQNSRIELGMWGRISGTDPEGGSPHPDIIQPWGGVKHLYVDKLTGLVTYQGLMLKSDFYDHLNEGRTLKRINFRAQEPGNDVEINDTDPPNTSPIPEDRSWPNYLWWTDGLEGEVSAENVWFNHPNRTFDGGKVFWPHGYTTGNDAAGHYAIPVGANGKVYEGNPPGGDFVAEGAVGTQYQSPGYGMSEEPTPDLIGDLNSDGRIDVYDLSLLLAQWNKTGLNSADLNGDSIVNVIDLSAMLGAWDTSTAQ